MTQQERMALINLLDRIKPECSIEIGTLHGGSLSAISKFSQKVYALDCDPSCKERLSGIFPNVELITGYSNDTLPPLLDNLQQMGVYVPLKPLYIAIHDSFMPECRKGMLDADWASSPYVHFVEIDFIPGRFNSDKNEDSYRKMTCGLAIAFMSPLKREKELKLLVDGELPFNILKQNSSHKKSITRYATSAFRKKLGSVKRKIKSYL